MNEEELHPFRVEVPDGDLVDLRDRLERTRWTPGPDPAEPDYGLTVAVVRPLAEYWRDHYDWRVHEARLKAHPQITTEVLARSAIPGPTAWIRRCPSARSYPRCPDRGARQPGLGSAAGQRAGPRDGGHYATHTDPDLMVTDLRAVLRRHPKLTARSLLTKGHQWLQCVH